MKFIVRMFAGGDAIQLLSNVTKLHVRRDVYNKHCLSCTDSVPLKVDTVVFLFRSKINSLKNLP